MRHHTISASLLFGAILIRSAWVGANFFTRKFSPGEDARKKAAPAGASAALGSQAKVGSVVTFQNSIPLARLSNNNGLPLVGLGVGNIQDSAVAKTIAEALQEDKKTYLIDASHKIGNLRLVAAGINEGVGRASYTAEPFEIHVLTKIWYTHLGYARTKHSVQESLLALKPVLDNEKVDLKLHVLIQWPRCFKSMPWMDCEAEERQLSDEVKAIGPDPSKDPDNAWKETWKALEDMYLSDHYPIASIGLSNFQLHQIESMTTFAKVHPHLLQLNLWSLLFDPLLVQYCHKYRIHIQAYNALQHTVSLPEAMPRAYHHLQKIAIDVTEMGVEATPAQVILAWLIQHGVSVTPSTTSSEHLAENSALSLTDFPALTDMQVETIAHAVEAYLSGNDLEQDIHVTVTFHAVTKDMVLYWTGHDGEETRIKLIRKGDMFHETTYPNHKFRTYLATNKDVYIEHEIENNFGDHKNIYVEL